MIKLNDFSVNPGATPIRHHETVEPRHHACMALDSAGHVDLSDVTVHSGVLLIAFVHNGRAEWVTDLRINAGQRVIQTNSERYVVWNAEVLR